MTELVEALRALGKAIAAPVVSIGAVLVGVALAGLVAIGLAWRGAAAQEFVPKQVPFLVSGGLGGLALLIVALGLLDVHTNRVQAALRHADTNVALREAVALLALAPELRRRRATPPRPAAQPDDGVRSRVKARAAQPAPARRTTGTRKTAG